MYKLSNPQIKYDHVFVQTFVKEECIEAHKSLSGLIKEWRRDPSKEKEESIL